MSDRDRLHIENMRLHRLLAQAGIDAAESEVAANLQKVIIGELSHRVKNLMAMVLAITTQTIRSSQDLKSAQEAVRSRLTALSRTHDLVLGADHDTATLKSIMERAVEPFAQDGKFSLSVPDVAVTAPSPALTLSLVINELCTNAVKYGALSVPDGRVDLKGTVEGDSLRLLWTETNGPPVVEPSSLSFGARMIQASVAGSEVNLRFLPTGAVCEMRIPLAVLNYSS
jgi:two-component sensor histidine kinase